MHARVAALREDLAQQPIGVLVAWSPWAGLVAKENQDAERLGDLACSASSLP